MKTCSKCGDPNAEFYKNASARDGLRSSCKACSSISYAKWKAANPGKTEKYKAKYYALNIEKVKAAAKKWSAANPEKYRDSVAKYRSSNIQKCREKSAKWQAENPARAKENIAKWRSANTDRHRTNAVKWRAANPELRRIYCHNRRAKKRKNGGKLSAGLAERLFKLQRGKCPCCKQPLGTDYHMDHIMPIDLGGANEDWNIQLLRSNCNQRKHAKHPIDFMQQKGFLL